jgi:hypothetical protein
MSNINIFVTINMYLITLMAHLSRIMSMCRLFLGMYSTLYVVTIYLSCTLQVAVGGTKQLQLSSTNILESFMAGGTNTVSYESGKVGPSIMNNKGFFMFSIVDVSSIIDFSRATIDEGVVDSPPSKEIGRILVCSSSPLKSSRKDGICRSLSPESYGGSTHPRQLYGSGPSHVSNGLDMTNAGESFPHYGVDGTEVRSEALPTVDKTIMRTRSPHGLSSQYYAGEQLQRIQRQCGPKGSRSEGIQQLQNVEKKGVSIESNHPCQRIEWRKELSKGSSGI